MCACVRACVRGREKVRERLRDTKTEENQRQICVGFTVKRPQPDLSWTHSKTKFAFDAADKTGSEGKPADAECWRDSNPVYWTHTQSILVSPLPEKTAFVRVQPTGESMDINDNEQDINDINENEQDVTDMSRTLMMMNRTVMIMSRTLMIMSRTLMIMNGTLMITSRILMIMSMTMMITSS